MLDRRNLPKIDELAKASALADYPAKLRAASARAAVDLMRKNIDAGIEDPRTAEQLAVLFAEQLASASLAPAINLSGVILHTGLGRARLAPSAAKELACVAGGHANVEIDLESGRRGDRQTHVRKLLTDLTGAEDAFVVNNAAAGVLLSLSALCSGREVILSRGQMVEIGGSFRMPDVVRQSGCKLVEVGCTNKTRMSDFENVLSEETAAILRCHPSNFKIVGFHEEPSLDNLAAFARKKNILIIDDQGSGAIVDLTRFGLSHQPTLPGSLAGGADIAIASGDKLLGGPQAGIIVGKKDLVAKIRKHPLARCVRIDKLTLAALEATLRLYRNGQEDEIPTIRYLGRDPKEIKKMAKEIAVSFAGASVEEGLTEVGGGSCPGEGLPTWRVGLPSGDPDGLARKLRSAIPPIVARIEDDKVWLDPRTLEPDELPNVTRVVSSL